MWLVNSNIIRDGMGLWRPPSTLRYIRVSRSKSKDWLNVLAAEIDASYASVLMWISRCLRVSDTLGDRPPKSMERQVFCSHLG
jgi:hypothetical protein